MANLIPLPPIIQPQVRQLSLSVPVLTCSIDGTVADITTFQYVDGDIAPTAPPGWAIVFTFNPDGTQWKLVVCPSCMSQYGEQQ